MTTEVCPVCRGCGLVPPGFYDPQPAQEDYLSSTGPRLRETCRACGGTGILRDHYAPNPTCTIDWHSPVDMTRHIHET